MGSVCAAEQAGAKPGESGRARGEVAVHVLLLPIEVDGTLPVSHREEYARRLAAPLTDGRFHVSTSENPSIEVALARCRQFRCRVEVANGIGAQLVVRTRIWARERNYRIQVELYEASSRKLIATSDESCELCGLGEVQTVVAVRAAVVRDKIESLLRQSANITVHSEPVGAALRIDGETLGETPAQLLIAPGEHRVEVSLEGYLPASKAVTVVRGVREIVEFPLEEKPAIGRGRRAELGSAGDRGLVTQRGWGWLALSGGTIAATTGIVFLALDERPFQSLCEGPANVDASGNCRYRYNTRLGGIVATSVGAVLVTTGISLLLKTRAGRPAATVGLSPTGACMRVRF
ncbi:MAG: PEGA domain-containing protein [Nannocystaceae bacterium]